MVGEDVKQTRCATCDADHAYKQARVPTPRRKKPDAALAGDAAEGILRPRAAHQNGPEEHEDNGNHDGLEDHDTVEELDEHESYEGHGEDEEPAVGPEFRAAADQIDASPAEAPAAEATGDEGPPPADEDGPVHRRLIRATLPRPEGQVPERKNPDFTIRQPGGREFDGNTGPHRGGRGRNMRTHGGGSPGHPTRFGGGGGGGQRHGSGPRHGSGQGPRHQGNRPGNGGNRGPGRGPAGSGGGRKRGR